MRYRMLAAIAAAVALSVGSAHAQTGATGGASQTGMSQSGQTNLDLDSLIPISEFETTVTLNGMSVATMKSSDVKGANDQNLGKVDKVLADETTSKVMAVTMNAGGKEVVVPVDRLTYDANAKAFTSSLSQDDLKSLPEWKR